MECFFPAQATGWALARTFMNQGEAAVPAGRLPATWPTNLQQVYYQFVKQTCRSICAYDYLSFKASFLLPENNLLCF